MKVGTATVSLLFSGRNRCIPKKQMWTHLDNHKLGVPLQMPCTLCYRNAHGISTARTANFDEYGLLAERDMDARN